MCGICGIINLDGSPIDPRLLISMRDSMAERGPDDKGAVLLTVNGVKNMPPYLEFQDMEELSGKSLAGYSTGLAHRRLSIIDLSQGGRQPMCNEDATVWITFNGEIYNFSELRTRLSTRGHRFRTRTDTEVIIHAYEEWGQDFASYLRGMYAIAIWDMNKAQCILTRDRFGIKPLFYFQDKKHLVFSSDIRALMFSSLFQAEINPEAVLQYFKYHYVPAPNTIFKKVSAVLPAQVIILAGDNIRENGYWYPTTEETIFNEKKAIDEIEKELHEVVQKHLVADVPVGCFLSGGIDSSLISFYAKETIGRSLKAYCIGFKQSEYDESHFARMVAAHLGIDLDVDVLQRPPEFPEMVKMIMCCDQPFADSSLIPTYQVCRNARKLFPVALSGDGGDEVFAGYSLRLQNMASITDRYPVINFCLDSLLCLCKAIGFLNRLPISLRKFAQFKDLSLSDRYIFYHIKSFNFNSIVHPAIFQKGESHPAFIRQQTRRHELSNNLNGILALCLHNNLPNDMLAKVDRASMANSLEVRVPFLDHNLVETALKLAGSLKQPGIIRNRPKNVLKKIAEKKLPNETVFRRKMGFSIPINYWVEDKLNLYITKMLHSTNRSIFDYLSQEAIKCVIDQDKSRFSPHDKWAIFCFLVWFNSFQKSLS